MREGGNSMVDIKQCKMAGKNSNISVIIIDTSTWNGWLIINVLLKKILIQVGAFYKKCTKSKCERG